MPETTPPLRDRIAYVMKGYPRLSELFIASEIQRLEEEGLALRLFVIKPRDERSQHAVVDRTLAKPVYLPDSGSVSATSVVHWLRRYGGAFRPALRRAIVRRPIGVLQAAAAAAAQAVRARRSFFAPPRKVYLKEFFQAVALSDALATCGDVRHIHAHFCHGATTVAWLASYMTGVPFSFTAHAKDIYQGALNPAGLLPRKLRAARFAVTCTEASRKHLLTKEPSARVLAIHHGLNADMEALLQGPEPAANTTESFDVLGVGRRVPKKGFDVLVRACGLLRDEGVPVRLRLVGPPDGADDNLRALIEKHGLADRVELLGALDQRGLRTEYARAAVFALPCRVLPDGDRDGIPNVLVEAMACGVPVVTTCVSGIPELVTDGWSGLLVEPDDAPSLAFALGRLFASPGLAGRLSEAGRRTVLERFDGRRLARKMADLFGAPRG